jgi:biopolymer transport protein TolR
MAGDGSTSSKNVSSEPNVVPLCDILLVLLIIFMVVTPMIQKGANVKLPEAKNAISQPEPGQILTVYIKKDLSEPSGYVIYLEDKKLEGLSVLTAIIEDKLEELEDSKKKKVLLKADVEIPYGKVVDVMNEIKNAQIELLGLITEQYTSGT